MYLMQQCPAITADEYYKANQKYTQRVYDNYIWALKYKKDISTELTEIKTET
jgi:hypothetical protein